MANSPNIELPFVEAAQAQKHVTVNESLLRLDAVSQLVLQSLSETVPPNDAEDGEVYAVPQGAQPPWQALPGKLALRSNGGWVTITPRPGWQAWVVELGALCVFDGSGWVSVGPGAAGAGPRFEAIEFEHTVQSGGAQDTTVVIPAQSSVIGVTARVSDEITGNLTSWRLGAGGSDNRYGSGFGTAHNSFVRGLTGAPLAYYADTPLILTPENGAFSGGAVRFVIHMLQIDIPDLV
ncbi:conserved hypothetical protein [Dinoroseobacter shibae DFL 12 = DSM 16493]|jgi:hypothetical protein|uniref:Uncharacterized protein n=2 Tax=root TaxID=1 RepID=A8LQN1_DINSH|nr:DUF2793 domain-containing protein [Dinoroseobacter shibae]ABV93898.1 conserved hypothetical protein [Dinoroseobacter shibae DFL 12 = DSM 16493]URF45346.1 DUF2793 domain-containing protein [Dinoroseobacter shibae]URF49651.1 DUF2793 domain-containing protein [Dinoroseobacter shibae]DBA12223.1 TPA_asm: DUF2793 domain-containing protein [Dinogtaviriform tomaschi]